MADRSLPLFRHWRNIYFEASKILLGESNADASPACEAEMSSFPYLPEGTGI
jgi:hypothetical protein